jgi:malate dehydrogenase
MLNVGLEEIETIVLGAHGDSMVALESQTYIKNKPWTEFIDENKLKEAFNYAKKEGSKIVSLLQGGSAYFAPALSIYKMIDNILNNKKELISASCYLDGEYGLKDVCVGVPVRLGSQGVEKIVELDLTNDELSKLHQAANLIKSNNRKIV